MNMDEKQGQAVGEYSAHPESCMRSEPKCRGPSLLEPLIRQRHRLVGKWQQKLNSALG